MEIKIFSENLYNNSYAYLEDIRRIAALELQSLRDQANASTHFSKWKLYQSIALIIFVLICVAPPIIYLTVKTTLSGEKVIKALADNSDMISAQQQRNKNLLQKCLPPMIAVRFMEQHRVSFTYDASTVMFCSLGGFNALFKDMETVQVNLF